MALRNRPSRFGIALATAVMTASLTPVIMAQELADRANPTDGSKAAAAALRRQGLELGYNLDHAEALTAFDKAIDADPDDPTAYRLAAATLWIQMLFAQGSVTVDDYLGQARAHVDRPAPDAALAASFHRYLQRAIELGEGRLRERPREATAHFDVGAAYGFLASYTATVEGRVVAAFGAARRAYRENARALDLDPERYDAGLIVGMYRYAVADLSVPLRVLARIVGFGGDRARGRRLIEAAANHSSEVQANAQFALLLIYTREARFAEALNVIRQLQDRFPRNRLLWLEAGQTWLRAGKPREANEAIEEGLVRLARDPRPRAEGEDARWHYAHGAALVALRDSSNAQTELRAAIAGARRDWVRGRAHRELGKLADLGGDHARALGEYRLADRLCRQDHDRECTDEVTRLMKTAFR